MADFDLLITIVQHPAFGKSIAMLRRVGAKSVESVIDILSPICLGHAIHSSIATVPMILTINRFLTQSILPFKAAINKWKDQEMTMKPGNADPAMPTPSTVLLNFFSAIIFLKHVLTLLRSFIIHIVEWVERLSRKYFHVNGIIGTSQAPFEYTHCFPEK